MKNKGFGYIIFLLFLTLALGLVFAYQLIFLRYHQNLSSTYWQNKALKFAESGINYSNEHPLDVPQVLLPSNPTTTQLLNSSGLNYTFQEGSFTIFQAQGIIYSVGRSGQAVNIFQRKENRWQIFSE